MEVDVKTIERAAFAFRKAIEVSLTSDLLPSDMNEFPRGACGSSALLVGTFLTDNGLGEFTYVSGTERSSESDHIISHAWISRGSVIIDITQEQFAFTEKTSSLVFLGDDWHKRFWPFDLGGKAYLKNSTYSGQRMMRYSVT
jgi:hypothetical protein